MFNIVTDRSRSRLLIAGILWIAVVEFFLIQIIAQIGAVDYSALTQDISTLGVTECGPYRNASEGGVREVCSPWHVVLNGGFMVLGVIQLAGLVAGWRFWPKSRAVGVGLVLVGVSCLGTFATGLWPVNVNRHMHVAGAVLHFTTISIGLLIFGIGMRRHASGYGIYSAATGLIILTGFILYGVNQDLELGRGVMERIAAYPGAIWYMMTGTLMVLFARRADVA